MVKLMVALALSIVLIGMLTRTGILAAAGDHPPAPQFRKVRDHTLLVRNCDCSWPVIHDPSYGQKSHGCPDLETDPRTTVVAPAWSHTNCYGEALYPLYREFHPEGLFLDDHAAERLCNTYYRCIQPGEAPRRGDLLAYVVHRPSSQDPRRTVRALAHLATWWEPDRVLSKFDTGPLYMLPPECWPKNYPHVDEAITLVRLAPGQAPVASPLFGGW